FFSSRRRHTRSKRDWSSDVCSSDLGEFLEAGLVRGKLPRLYGAQAAGCAPIVRLVERGGDVLEPEVPQTICRSLAIGSPADGVRSGERRVGKGCGGWGAAEA